MKRKEEHYETLLRRLLEYEGWLTLKTDAGAASRVAQKSLKSDIPSGFPDLLAVRPNRAVFIEVKTPSGRVGPLQRNFHTMLTEMGFEVYVVWGDDHTELLENEVLTQKTTKFIRKMNE